VLYNNSDNNEVVPVNAGRYVVKVEVAESDEYALTTLELPDSLEVKKAVLTAAYLSYTPQSVPYDGNTHEVGVSLVEPYTGLGELTVKYDNSETPPSAAGTYAVTVSVAEGDNFGATAEDILLGNFVIREKPSVTLAELDYTVADVTYDGSSHEVSVTAQPDVTLGSVSVLYNNSDNSEVVPVNAGWYVVKVEVAESDEYALTTLELPDTFKILKAVPDTSLLNYAGIDSVEYSGEAYTVSVSPKESIIGLGAITVKYNDGEAAPVEAGAYLVTVDIGEGDNYLEALQLSLGQLVVYVAPTDPSTAVESSAALALNAYVANKLLHVTDEVESVQVVNITGVAVMSARVAGGRTLSVAHLPAGIYLVALQGGGETRVVKLVIVN
jgi:hypothetical protein